MNKKYYTLNNDRLLPSESYAWISLNSCKSNEAPHTLLIEIEEIQEIEDSLKNLMSQFANWEYQHGYNFDELKIDHINFHRGGGEWKKKVYLVGVRSETVEELNYRLLKEKEILDSIKSKEKLEEEQKIKKEYEKYLKLKARYEGGGQ